MSILEFEMRVLICVRSQLLQLKNWIDNRLRYCYDRKNKVNEPLITNEDIP